MVTKKEGKFSIYTKRLGGRGQVVALRRGDHSSRKVPPQEKSEDHNEPMAVLSPATNYP
jgi:hypothetical protein